MKTALSTLYTGALSALTVLMTLTASAAGTLTPVESGCKPAEILSHDVKVVINNGFAKTEVVQQFRNGNDRTVEAVYSFPLPKSASLSEVTVQIGEKTITGEVVDKKTAERIYGEEKKKGSQAALATKEGYQDFQFQIANLAPSAQATVRFVYYQPLPVDTGVVRYVYPLEEGGTKDCAAEAFWTRNSKTVGKTTLHMIVRSAWPLEAVRAPGGTVVDQKLELKKGIADLSYELESGLERDFVFYYQLASGLPGRLEVIPYKKAGAKEGTFLMALTPGIDLKPIRSGADYTFVLDQSGSMSGSKFRTLCEGVVKTLEKMHPEDRFRIITFESSASDFTRGWVAATPENIRKWGRKLSSRTPCGGTNLYAAMKMALGKLDADRVTSIVLVTDGVTNTGVVSPQAFHKLMKSADVRVFGFLMGNSANWPLMRTICNASGGFYEGVSNNDDIFGKLLLAKSKIAFESLHDAEVKISGVSTFDLTGESLKKLYRGQQLVIFGRYRKGGEADVSLKVRLSGREQTYKCRVNFPESDLDTPELERLWAMSRIEMFEDMVNAGLTPKGEAASVIRDLGLQYQLVTDETSMLVLSDEAFESYHIERRNRSRIAEEHAAQSRRQSAPVRNYRADLPRSGETDNSMFHGNAPRLGGGAVSPFLILIAMMLVMTAAGTVGGMRKTENEK